MFIIIDGSGMWFVGFVLLISGLYDKLESRCVGFFRVLERFYRVFSFVNIF